MKSIGILAGVGRLPVEVARASKLMGLKVYAIGLLDSVDAQLSDIADDYKYINVARLGEIIDYLKTNKIQDVIMIGKVSKELLFSGEHASMDATMMSLLSSLPNQEDDTLMMAFVSILSKENINVLDQTSLIKILLPQPGILTKREPSDAEKSDMEFGFKIAKELGGLDIGQSVVVKDKAVMALEAIEGTDACIIRGGKLARGGAVVVKVAKPMQDNRFDMPAIGVKTIESMIESDCRALAIESGRTLIVDRESLLDLANQHGITIVAM